MKTGKLVLIGISANFLATFLPLHHPVAAQKVRKVTRTNTTAVGGDSRLKDEVSRKARLPFISDLRVVPSASNAIVSFKSSQRRLPLVEIGKVPPTPDRFGILAFPLGTSLFSRFVQLQDGRYNVYRSNAPIPQSERFPSADEIRNVLKDPNRYWSFFVRTPQREYMFSEYSRQWIPTKSSTIKKGPRITRP